MKKSIWLQTTGLGATLVPLIMLTLGTFGMLLGLMVDTHGTELELISNLCGQTDRNLWSMLKLHWALLPWMHAGMWVGGFAAIPLMREIRLHCRRQFCVRLVQNIVCSSWMTAGMLAGALVSENLSLQFGVRSPGPMLGGMFSGMIWGMAASASLYRLYYRVVPIFSSAISPRTSKVL